MSVPVALEEIANRIAELGTSPLLVTVGEEGPHITSVAVTMADGTFEASVGRRTAANLEARPHATLLWPAPPGADYCLLVDVTGTAADALAPTKAVLHRMATADPELPNCIRLDGG